MDSFCLFNCQLFYKDCGMGLLMEDSYYSYSNTNCPEQEHRTVYVHILTLRITKKTLGSAHHGLASLSGGLYDLTTSLPLHSPGHDSSDAEQQADLVLHKWSV